MRERTLEAYAKHYTMAWPHEEYESARPRKTSRLYATLAAKGACFGSKLGWERPNWFARPGSTPEDVYSYGRQNWFESVGEEHRAARERVALFDQSSFAKFEVRGKGAEAALDHLCAGDVTRAPGRIAYTQMLNARGGIECDLTVSRFAPDLYFIVTGTGFRTHDLAWIDAQPAGPHRGRDRRCDGALWLPLADGAARPRRAHKRHARGCFERSLPLRRLPRDRDRRREASGFAHHLCGRARLRAARAG